LGGSINEYSILAISPPKALSIDLRTASSYRKTDLISILRIDPRLSRFIHPGHIINNASRVIVVHNK
jgi:hypothetical protein